MLKAFNTSSNPKSEFLISKQIQIIKFQVEENMNKKGVSQIFITIVVALVTAGVVGGGIWYYQQKQVDKANQEKLDQTAELNKQLQEANKGETKESSSKTEIKDETADWKTYKDSKNGYEIKHPKEFSEEKCEGDNNTVFFLIKDKLICDSDAPFSGVIIKVGASNGDSDDAIWTSEGLDQFNTETKKLGSYKFKIISGVQKSDAVFYEPKSVIRQAELIEGNKRYIFTYRQRDISYTDQSETFDLMLSTFKIN